MPPSNSGPSPRDSPGQTDLADAREAYVDAKSVGTDDRPGRYARNADSILDEFTRWVHSQHDIQALAEIDTNTIRSYVRWLARQQRNGDLAVSTTHTYFKTVRAWLGWCSRNGWLASNPAAVDDATEDLPTESGTERDSRQVWTSEARHDLLMWVRRRKESAYDLPLVPSGLRLFRTRSHALVTLLARTGVRGAEVLRDPENSRRDGLTWDAVDFEEETIEVFGKSQQYEYVPFPESAHGALRQWRREFDPTSANWPVFPGFSANSLAAAVRKSRNGRVPDHEVDDAVDSEGYLLGYLRLAREHDSPPSAMTTEAGRNTMQQLCETAGVTVDGEYLKPHGGRRKLGDELYRVNPAMSQQALRHQDLGVTKQSYSYIDQGEVAEEIDRLQNE